MEKKILAIMIALMAIAATVAVVALVVGEGGGGGGFSSGGFTSLFDDLEGNESAVYRVYLEAPSSWDEGDDVKVTDTIVDMAYDRVQVGNTYVYTTVLWFVYAGEKWNDPEQGSRFYVPVDRGEGWMQVSHGLFSIEISSATNISAEYDVGDNITLETTLVQNVNVDVAFGVWMVEDTL